jgi:hypothetical protein
MKAYGSSGESQGCQIKFSTLFFLFKGSPSTVANEDFMQAIFDI